MKVRTEFTKMLGIDDWYKYGCGSEFRKRIKKLNQTEYYVYRENYVCTKSGEIKEPSIYIFDNYFIKVKGTGHAEFGQHIHDEEYEIFLTRETALEYALKEQKKFFERKEQDNIKKIENEITQLHSLAEKYGYTLIKNEENK